LANADIKKLSQSLNSLENQDLSPIQPNQVLLIDSGDVPPQKLKLLCQKYPWLKVYQSPSKIGYYQAKMPGANTVTDEIVVYCDSDCIYESNWLRNLLLPFTQNDEIQIVAGETTTLTQGIYGTAMALTYIFSQYSKHKILKPTSQYFSITLLFAANFSYNTPFPPN